jgi:hypothetical protein
MLSTRVASISTNGPSSGAHRSILVMGFYHACYIVGMFVTGILNEARYSLISVCNELLFTPIKDMQVTRVVTCLLAGYILEPARIWQSSRAASCHPGPARICQPPQQGDIRNTFSSHHIYRQARSHI